MKKLISAVLAVLFLGCSLNAWEPNVQVAPRIREILNHETQVVNVTTTTWYTITPAPYRSGIILDNPESNSSDVILFFSTHTTASDAGLTTASVGYELIPDDPWIDLPADSSIYIHLLSTGAATQKFIYTEYGSTKY